MSNEKREQQISNKAKELGQKYFPDEANIWARGNIEAEYVESACIEMAKWADQHPHWIPVEEELPKINDVASSWDCSDEVYVYLATGSHCIGRYEHDKDTNEFYWVLYGVDKDIPVTHWMSLPEAPRKEE